jgi:hypothetical protein
MQGTNRPSSQAPASAKPGTKDPAAQKEKKPSKRVKHPLVGNKEPKIYPFKSTPADYVHGKMQPFKKKDFATDDAYFTYRAEEYDAKAKDFRGRADQAKLTGSGKDKGKAKRLLKMQEKMKELEAQLKAQGVDVDALLAQQTEPAASA